MIWILTILGSLAALILGMYQLGPGMNKRRERKKQQDWVEKWKDVKK